jgi:hypothetical protein
MKISSRDFGERISSVSWLGGIKTTLSPKQPSVRHRTIVDTFNCSFTNYIHVDWDRTQIYLHHIACSTMLTEFSVLEILQTDKNHLLYRHHGGLWRNAIIFALSQVIIYLNSNINSEARFVNHNI